MRPCSFSASLTLPISLQTEASPACACKEFGLRPIACRNARSASGIREVTDQTKAIEQEVKDLIREERKALARAIQAAGAQSEADANSTIQRTRNGPHTRGVRDL
jgi:hypothetical protein